jgi:hypothetical protein
VRERERERERAHPNINVGGGKTTKYASVLAWNGVIFPGDTAD